MIAGHAPVGCVARMWFIARVRRLDVGTASATPAALSLSTASGTYLLASGCELLLRHRTVAVSVCLHDSVGQLLGQLVLRQLAILVGVEAVKEGAGIGSALTTASLARAALALSAALAAHVLTSGFEFFLRYGTVAVGVGLHDAVGCSLR